MLNVININSCNYKYFSVIISSSKIINYTISPILIFFTLSCLKAWSQNCDDCLSLVCPSVRMEQLGFHWREFHEISYLSIFRKSINKIKFQYNLTTITMNLDEDRHTFLIISHSILLGMRKVSDKVVEKIGTHFISKSFFFFFNRAVYKTMRTNVLQPGSSQMTVCSMCIACWMTKAADTHTQNM
jgi:hypothetical protein